MLNKFRNVLYGSSDLNDDLTGVEKLDQSVKLARGEKRELRTANWTTTTASNNNNNNNDNKNNSSVGMFNKDKAQHNNGKEDRRISFSPRDISRLASTKSKVPKFKYSRPEFLQLKTDDEISVSADHQIRPIILPRDVTKLPWNSGYAECINAGKSARNEDQAVYYQDVIVKKETSNIAQQSECADDSIINEIPWYYFGIFDGHAGNAVAVAAANQLHKLIADKLQGIADILITLEFETEKDDDNSSAEDRFWIDKQQTSSSDDEKPENDNESASAKPSTPNGDTASNDQAPSSKSIDGNDETANILSETKVADVKLDKTPRQVIKKSQSLHIQQPLHTSPDRWRNVIIAQKFNISVDELITGVLETAFCEMDALIAKDKQDYDMRGGCTAIVSLFILGKLFVCNAGDSRAIVIKSNEITPMSFDFTPITERERILRLGQQRPELMGTDFTHLEFLKKPTRHDLGKQMLYKDAYMTGWAMKTITYDDLKFPLVWGEGKRSRVLATIGVTRGFGDHELRAQYGSVPIKPFLTPEPEVQVMNLEDDDELSAKDILIIGSDGLWDVTTNEDAAMAISLSSQLFPESKESRSKYQFMMAAQDLVIQSRGHTLNWNNVWRMYDDSLASLDDISVFVIPLKQYRDEYVEWKRLRSEMVANKSENSRLHDNESSKNIE